MAAIGLGQDQASKYLVPGVQVACENSNSSVTLSGDIAPLEHVMAAIKKDFPDVLNRKLQVSMAYHSCEDLPLPNFNTSGVTDQFTRPHA